MSRVELAPEVGLDFDRILEHLVAHEAADASARIEDIIRAIDVLERNPLIGRTVRADLRELVIGRRTRGYVALYRYVGELDTAFILAIRGQKEAGYARTLAAVKKTRGRAAPGPGVADHEVCRPARLPRPTRAPGRTQTHPRRGRSAARDDRDLRSRAARPAGPALLFERPKGHRDAGARQSVRHADGAWRWAWARTRSTRCARSASCWRS